MSHDLRTLSSKMKNVLMFAMSSRIKMARDNLNLGWHDPELACLHGALKLIENFEAKLKSELDDID